MLLRGRWCRGVLLTGASSFVDKIIALPPHVPVGAPPYKRHSREEGLLLYWGWRFFRGLGAGAGVVAPIF